MYLLNVKLFRYVKSIVYVSNEWKLGLELFVILLSLLLIILLVEN